VAGAGIPRGQVILSGSPTSGTWAAQPWYFERGNDMTSIKTVAEAFFTACDTGKGWEHCSAYCTPEATFSAQAEPLLELKTLAQYTDWMKKLMTVLPDGRCEVNSFATDTDRNNVAAYAVFHATHTGPGGPVPPTNRRTSTDYVYVMQFEGDKIVHMTKIWNAGLALKDLGRT
jgi:predicted ester cyclase